MDYSEAIEKIKLDYWITFLGVIIIPIAFLVLLVLFIRYLYRTSDHFKHVTKKQWPFLVLVPFLVTGMVFIFLYVPKVIMDFSNVREDGFIVDVCTVIGQSNAGNPMTPQSRSPVCGMENTGEEIQLTIFYTPMNIGEKYTIVYLPNTKLGRVLNKIE